MEFSASVKKNNVSLISLYKFNIFWYVIKTIPWYSACRIPSYFLELPVCTAIVIYQKINVERWNKVGTKLWHGLCNKIKTIKTINEAVNMTEAEHLFFFFFSRFSFLCFGGKMYINYTFFSFRIFFCTYLFSVKQQNYKYQTHKPNMLEKIIKTFNYQATFLMVYLRALAWLYNHKITRQGFL